MKVKIRSFLNIVIIMLIFILINKNISLADGGDAVWWNTKDNSLKSVQPTNGKDANDWIPLNGKDNIEKYKKQTNNASVIYDDRGNLYNFVINVQKTKDGYQGYYTYNNQVRTAPLTKIKGTNKYAIINSEATESAIKGESGIGSYVPVFEEKKGKLSISEWILVPDNTSSQKDFQSGLKDKNTKKTTKQIDDERGGAGIAKGLQTAINNTPAANGTSQDIKDGKVNVTEPVVQGSEQEEKVQNEQNAKAITKYIITSPGTKTIDDISVNDYDAGDIKASDAKAITDKASYVLGIIRNISAVVAVIVLMIIGIKYMLGSAEEKADYKATMVPYIIGCVLAVSSTTLASFIYNAIH